MDNDDEMVGRILSRRDVLKLLGVAGASVLVGCGPVTTSSTQATRISGEGAGATSSTAGAASATTEMPTLNAEAATVEALDENPSAVASLEAEAATAEAANTAIAAADGTVAPACVVRPEVTEGPYYVDVGLVRSDIRTDTTSGEAQEGVPLTLTFNVSQVSNAACTVLEGATVEIWHCNSQGDYSGVSDPGFNTTDQNWLRGAQVTDANGVATFTTIYPGWYPGRAVHIHFKVSPNETQAFTSQLFFDDALSQQVFTQEPYATNGTTPNRLNSTDNIYQDLLLLTTTQSGDGYAATFPIGIDLSR